ncbi:MAG: ABC transporter permease subunit [Cellulomonas sp.]|nr:ABC transporter permease subunit [Cellulomonas sp.]
MMLQRALQSVLVIFLMSVLAFVGINLVGDPIHLLVAPDASHEEIQRASQELGLDLPVHEQYLRFLGNALRGDLGNSFVFNRPAVGLIFERMPATFELATMALLLTALVGVPLGLWAGLRPGSKLHKFAMSFSIFGVTMPVFWLGLILILVFSVNLGWLPSGGRGETTSLLGIQVSFLTWDGLKFMLLPACTLALNNIALIMRITEAGTRKRLAVHVVTDPALVPQIATLGVEPLSDAFTADRLGALLAERNQQVKGLLRDQGTIAGIGNAYSDEILFVARTSPFRLTGSYGPDEVTALHGTIRAVLGQAVEAAAGKPAAELKDSKRRSMRVHGRTGEPCPGWDGVPCGDTVHEVSFADSALQYCPTCQTGGKPLADRRMSRLLR